MPPKNPIISPEHDSEQPNFEGVRGVELDLPAPLERANFTENAAVILDIVRQAKREGTIQTGFEHGLRYAMESGHPQLAWQADLMLAGPIAFELQNRLDQFNFVRDQASNNVPEAVERQAAGYRKLLTRYNHGIRDLIYANPQTFNRNDLESWLSLDGMIPDKFVGSKVAGVAAEVAAARMLAHVPGISSVNLSSVDDDSRGIDLWLSDISNRQVAVDVKTGAAQPQDRIHLLKARQPYQTEKLILGLDQIYIDNFEVKADQADFLIKETGRELGLAP